MRLQLETNAPRDHEESWIREPVVKKPNAQIAKWASDPNCQNL